VKKFLLLFLLNFFLIWLSLAIGAAHLSFSQIFQTLLHPGENPETFYILSSLRFPRTMALVSIGLSLGFAGVILQTLLDNPLSEPYTLGLSGGATLGAVIALLAGVQPVWLTLPFGAVAGCVLSTAIVLYFLNQKILWKTNSIILIGVMISLFCGSFVTLIISALEPAQVQTAIYWMMGQVGSSRDHWWPALAIAFVISIFLGIRKSLHLDRLLLGEDSASNLGTDVHHLRVLFIVVVCVLTALAVSIAGLVGFIGLVSPHISYQLFRSRRHRKTLLSSSLVGSILFLCADILARLLSRDIELPSGSLMAILGAPILVYYLVKGMKSARAV
jgi:iron complex transport system permease protein